MTTIKIYGIPPHLRFGVATDILDRFEYGARAHCVRRGFDDDGNETMYEHHRLGVRIEFFPAIARQEVNL